VHRLQKQKLLDAQEQEEHAGQAAAEQVLPEVQKTYAAQGNQGIGQ
jgi:hypothetical protein